MNNRVCKRILSAIMAASIIMSQIPGNQVFAAEAAQEEGVEVGADLEASQEKETDIVEENTELESGEVLNFDTEAVQEIEEPKEVEEVQEPAETEELGETQQDENTLLNYVFVEKPYITAPDVQNIMANIGTASTVLENAVLQYRNAENGEVQKTSATELVGNTVLFTINHQEQESAAYKLIGMTYTIEGKEYSIDFADAGMDVKYGVNKEVETTPDDMLVTGDAEGLSGVDANIVTTNEEGQVLSEQDIQEALESSEQSLPATNTLGDINSISKATNGNLVVVLDPGHDSTHGGTNHNGCVEQDIVLKIAQYCKAELEKYDGVTVYLTREGKTCPNGGSSVASADCNAKRVEFAASKKANVYVSFHLNYNANTSADGAGVYYPNSNYRPDLGQEGKELAQKIFDELHALGLDSWAGGTLIRNSEDNTLYPDGSLADYLGVIRRCKETGIPAVLIEHAFVSNLGDVNNFLNSDEKLQKLGIADATAIAEYYSLNEDPKGIYNGVDYSAVYDFNYYINRYSDIKRIYGNNPTGALVHFVKCGMKEGRQAKETFHVQSYYNRYKDLRRVFGNDLKSYYMHYIGCGQREGRIATSMPSMQNYETVYNGIDYSAVYDYNYYVSKYSDIKRIYGVRDIEVLKHFVDAGMREGRQGKADFNVTTYMNRYVDLRNTFGTERKSYYMHYIQCGKKEGRSGAGTASLTGTVTRLNGVDYSAVYDYNYYLNRYSDLKSKLADNDIALLEHFVNCGMKEGRQAKEEFHVQSYYNKYKDLRRVFGNNLKSYYMHYIMNGKKEGRTATGVPNMQNYETIYNGIDYSAVYDYNYYTNKYRDIKGIYGPKDGEVLKHFVNYGIKEGHQGKSEFNVNYYKNNYSDLASKFGDDLKTYYLHYINHGEKEGRVADRQFYTSIMGNSNVTVAQMAAYYKANATYPSYYAANDAEAKTIEDFCRIYIEECNAEGVRAEVAFAQAILETGFLQYKGDVLIEQYNFAGLDASGKKFDDAGNLIDVDRGRLYSSVRQGIRAHVQRLKAWAVKGTTPSSFKNPCVDPDKFDSNWWVNTIVGSAPHVEWLGKQENPNGFGWATAAGYGALIKNNMARLMKY